MPVPNTKPFGVLSLIIIENDMNVLLKMNI